MLNVHLDLAGKGCHQAAPHDRQVARGHISQLRCHLRCLCCHWALLLPLPSRTNTTLFASVVPSFAVVVAKHRWSRYNLPTLPLLQPLMLLPIDATNTADAAGCCRGHWLVCHYCHCHCCLVCSCCALSQLSLCAVVAAVTTTINATVSAAPLGCHSAPLCCLYRALSLLLLPPLLCNTVATVPAMIATFHIAASTLLLLLLPHHPQYAAHAVCSYHRHCYCCLCYCYHCYSPLSPSSALPTGFVLLLPPLLASLQHLGDVVNTAMAIAVAC
jgi:hypothetical protein